MSLCADGAAFAGGSAELSAVLERLGGEEPPLLWVGPMAAECARVRDAVRYAALEINEHLETYFDRREHALEVIAVQLLYRCPHKSNFFRWNFPVPVGIFARSRRF